MPKQTVMTPSEQYVFSLARRASLSLWSYARPCRSTKDHKELCDVLIAFENDIAIISVKETRLSGASDTRLQRWERKTIEASIGQIYGAEKQLRSLTHVIRHDGTYSVALPSVSERIIHRIAVAFGSQGLVSISSGDFGKGFVHTFTERTFDIILRELDTPADLFSYLRKKVQIASTANLVFLEGGEEDLLAYYLSNGRTFPEVTGVFQVGSGIWSHFSSRPEVIARNKSNEDSVIWDSLIERFAHDALEGTLEPGSSLTSAEMALRRMAAEDRYSRRLLGRAFDQFLKQSAMSISSRLVTSNTKTTYVFLAAPHGTDRQARVDELKQRCFVARGKVKDNHTVVGIATEQYIPGKGHSLDLLLLYMPEWTLEDDQLFEEIQSNNSFFVGNLKQLSGEDEYPSVNQ